MQKGPSKDLPHWEQRGLGHGLTLHCHGLQDVQTCLFVSFRSLLSTFWETSHSTLFHCYSIGQGVDLDSPTTWAKVIAKKDALFRRVMTMAMENLSIAQHWDTLRYAHTLGYNYKPKVKQFDVGDFVYLQRQPNDTLDTSSDHTILRIKAIRPLGVLELQGVDKRTIQNHSKNYAPCHMPNLDPTIITSTWIPPLDYPCQVCQRTDDADQMLLCDNCNGGYHLLCLKPEFIQVPADIWYFHHVFLQHLDFYSDHATFFLVQVLGGGGGYMRISS
jgi:hypothetical protein